MQILLANAKIMNDCSEVQPLTTPMFQTVANELAAEMALCDIDTLAKELDCSRSLAAENWRRYQNFHMFPLWFVAPIGCHCTLSHGTLCETCHDRR